MAVQPGKGAMVGWIFWALSEASEILSEENTWRSKLSFDELTTILVEVEAVLNSRPLTYLYSDDVEEPLTPSHLVIGRRLLTLPVGPLQIDDWGFGDRLTATKRSRYLADRIQHFRRRWQREYLVDLREFHRPKGKNVTLPPERINDVVIFHDQGTSQRAFWKLARITDLIRGRNGKVRGARVLVAGKKTLTESPFKSYFLWKFKLATQNQPMKIVSRKMNIAEWMTEFQLHRQDLVEPQRLLQRRKSSLLTTC